MCIKEPLISFIVPCYNGEQYISNIVKEIETSTFKEFELIIVNDGSEDNTEQVSMFLADEYENVYYVSKVGEGASSARNYGLKLAKGKYICFVDCDDHFYGANLTKIVEKLNDQDLLLFNVNKNTKLKVYPYIKQHTNFSSKESLIANNQYINAPWGRLIKRDLIVRNNLYFDTSLKVSEDLLWCSQVLEVAQYIDCIDIDMYEYVTDNANSTTNSIDEGKIKHLWTALEKSYDDCSDNNYCDACFGLLAYHYMMNLAYSYVKFDLYKSYINKYKFLLDFAFNKRVKVVKYLVKVIGVKATSKLLNLYMCNK